MRDTYTSQVINGQYLTLREARAFLNMCPQFGRNGAWSPVYKGLKVKAFKEDRVVGRDLKPKNRDYVHFYAGELVKNKVLGVPGGSACENAGCYPGVGKETVGGVDFVKPFTTATARRRRRAFGTGKFHFTLKSIFGPGHTLLQRGGSEQPTNFFQFNANATSYLKNSTRSSPSPRPAVGGNADVGRTSEDGVEDDFVFGLNSAVQITADDIPDRRRSVVYGSDGWPVKEDNYNTGKMNPNDPFAVLNGDGAGPLYDYKRVPLEETSTLESQLELAPPVGPGGALDESPASFQEERVNQTGGGFIGSIGKIVAKIAKATGAVSKPAAKAAASSTAAAAKPPPPTAAGGTGAVDTTPKCPRITMPSPGAWHAIKDKAQLVRDRFSFMINRFCSHCGEIFFVVPFGGR